jgi:hypothetical protein
VRAFLDSPNNSLRSCKNSPSDLAFLSSEPLCHHQVLNQGTWTRGPIRIDLKPPVIGGVNKSATEGGVLTHGTTTPPTRLALIGYNYLQLLN